MECKVSVRHQSTAPRLSFTLGQAWLLWIHST
jgi:hypothetical protein